MTTHRFPPSATIVTLLSPFLLAASANQPAWRTLTTDAYPKKRDDIQFVNRMTGFYGTGKGTLYRTTDGGQIWSRIWNHPGTFIRAVGFIDARRGFIGNLGPGIADVTDPSALYRTIDGGESWEPVDLGPAALPGVCVIDIVHARAIHEGDVRDRIVIHAAGRANGPAKLVRSEDGGATWRLIDLSDRAGMILDVKFMDPDIGYVFAATSSDLARSNALILRTGDGGRSWREVYRSARSNEIIWKSAFPDQRTAYATIQNDDAANVQQRIVKSVDGGLHWKEIPLVRNAKAQEFGIGFINARHGWVGTASGGFETRDGGRSWIDSALAPKTNKIRTHAVDGTPMVYAIGSQVQIWDDVASR
jgi:photosystem II stability/assembly factor-like uncharacterized protein